MIILLVEDEPVRLKEIKRCLESDSVKVVGVDNGWDAIKLLRTQKFDGVCADMNMPFMSGYALIENIRKDQSTKSVPVFVYSSRPISEDNKNLAMEIGANECFRSTDPEGIRNEAMAYLR